MALSLFDEAVPKETKRGILSAMIMVVSYGSDGDDETCRIERFCDSTIRIVCNS